MKNIFLLLMITLFVGCQSTEKVTPSSVKNYGVCGKLHSSFVGDWFDYYKRGITYMDCEKWSEAESDLAKALNVRSIDKRRVYTLGMHFLNDYFPNRELGITYYNQSKFDQAIKYLSISYKQFPSVKARAYLVKSYQNNDRLKKANKKPPIIRLLNNSHRLVQLEFTDKFLIDKVKINNKKYSLTATMIINDASVSYEPLAENNQVSLNPMIYGDQDLLIEVIDVFGKKSSLIVDNKNDFTPPNLSLIKRDYKQNNALLTFDIKDFDSGIESIFINNKKLNLSTAIKQHQLKIKCFTEEVVPCSDSTINNFTQATLLVDSLSEDLNLTVVDRLGNTKTVSYLTTPLVNKGNNITFDFLDFPKSTQESSQLLELYLADKNGLQSVSINNKSYALNGSLESSINHIHPLIIGENKLEITVNTQNESFEKTLVINREQPQGFKFSERLKLAVFPFECKGSQGESCVKLDQQFDVFYQSFEDRKRFQTVSRNNLVQRLEQLKICEFIVNEKCAWEVTQLIGSQAMLVGKLTRRKINKGQMESVELYSKVIDAKTGDILITFDLYEEVTADQNLNSEALVSKIHNYFPLLNFSYNNNELELKQKQFLPWNKMPILGKGCLQNSDICYFDKLKVTVDRYEALNNYSQAVREVQSL